MNENVYTAPHQCWGVWQVQIKEIILGVYIKITSQLQFNSCLIIYKQTESRPGELYDTITNNISTVASKNLAIERNQSNMAARLDRCTCARWISVVMVLATVVLAAVRPAQSAQISPRSRDAGTLRPLELKSQPAGLLSLYQQDLAEHSTVEEVSRQVSHRTF